MLLCNFLAAQTTITIDPTQRYQTIDCWEAVANAMAMHKKCNMLHFLVANWA